MSYILDTNIISYILKRKNTSVENKLRQARVLGQDIFISCVTYYEVRRGLLYGNATKQLAEFDTFCRNYPILFLDDIEIIEKACEIHADLKGKGTPIQDADVLIASTAITRGLILVTNDSDMSRVSELSLENWL